MTSMVSFLPLSVRTVMVARPTRMALMVPLVLLVTDTTFFWLLVQVRFFLGA